MDKNIFKERITDILKNRLSAEELDISVKSISKNNGVIITSLCIRKKEETIITCINMDECYGMFMSGLSLEYVADEVIKCYRDSEKGKTTIDIGILDKWDEVKENLGIMVVSKAKNRDMLKKLVWREYLNLAIIPVVYMGDNTEDCRTVQVTKIMAEKWKGVDYDTVIDTAIENNRKNDPGMYWNMAELFKGINMDDYEKTVLNNVKIVSNSKCVNGASVILDMEMMDRLYEEFGGPVYLLPSSIHELLAVAADDTTPEEYIELIRKVNADDVKDEDVLDDCVYMYDGSELKVYTR